MSDSQAYEEISLDVDGVSVIKRYEKDEFPVPAIAFSFESRRDVDVTVTLWDDVPAEVEVEDLGFHPEYGSEFWDIQDEEIKFERELESGEEYTTVYGIRATGTDNIDQFLTTPEIEVDPPTMDEEDLAGGGDAVKEVISGESDDVPGLEEDEDVDTLDLNDPNEEQAASDESESEAEVEAGEDDTPDENDTTDDDAADATGEADSGSGGSVSVDGDSLVGAMATELRQNNVSKEDVKLLRKAFDLAAEEQGSVSAKVQKLQQDVSEVIAYTDALEEFLDENGTAAEIGDFQERFEEIRSDLESVESRVDEQADELDTLSDSVSDVEDEVGGVDETIEDLDDSVSAFEAQIEDIEDDLDELRDQVGSTDVDEEIENIEEEIEQLKEWREQLSSVIGGGE